MRVALMQMNVRRAERQANLERIARRIRSAEAELYVLPELATSGYLFADRRELRSMAEPARPGAATHDALCDLARSKSAYIVAGFPELDAGRIYNSAMLVGPRGLIGVYRKLHLFFREHLLFAPGDRKLKVYRLAGVRVGLMICFDWVFPETARSLALLGAQLIAHPSNLVLPYFQDAAITRALENRVFIATANRVGVERVGSTELRFTGRSQLVAPDGTIAGRAGQRAERTLVLEIDPQRADDKRLTPLDHLFRRRRPAFYRL